MRRLLRLFLWEPAGNKHREIRAGRETPRVLKIDEYRLRSEEQNRDEAVLVYPVHFMDDEQGVIPCLVWLQPLNLCPHIGSDELVVSFRSGAKLAGVVKEREIYGPNPLGRGEAAKTSGQGHCGGLGMCPQ